MILALWKKLMSGSPLLKSDFKVEKLAGWWGSACECEAREAAQAARALHRALAAHAHRAPRDQPLHKVPEEWQALWAGPEGAEAYLREFCRRARAAYARLQEPFAEDYLPKEVNLQEWLQPGRAAWALRALAAARLACAPGDLALAVKWDCADPEWGAERSPGLVVTGLRLSGAEWRGALVPAAATAPPLTPAPPLLLRYERGGSSMSGSAGSAGSVWVYSSASRGAGVLQLRAPLGAGLDAHTAALHAVALVVAPTL